MFCVKFLQLLACSTLLACSGLAAEEAAALMQDQVPDLLKKGIFIIQSEYLNTCIKADASKLILEDCSQFSKYMLWKWGSKQQLFNIGRSTCLGLNISNQEQPLSLVECNSAQHSLWWKCHGKVLIGASQYKLAVESDRFIVAKRTSSYDWKRFMAYDGDLCEPIEVSYFMQKHIPCWEISLVCRVFSHLNTTTNGTMNVSEMIEKADIPGVPQPANMSMMKNGAFAQIPFENIAENGLQWYCTIKLFIFHFAEQLNTKEVLLWIGLNQLDEAAGWQWSDGAPLALVNWKSDSWKFYPTDCAYNWYPYNRGCYKLHKEEKNWNEALLSCWDDNSTLISITSLADTEIIIKLLENENVMETWIGLHSNKTPVEFEWSDGTSVTLTSWHKQEPNIHQRESQHCVSAQQHGWERHGGYCYNIDKTPRSYQHASSGYYCPTLATIMSRFEQAFLNSMIINTVKMDNSYFWIALQDLNNTGEYSWLTKDGEPQPITFANWKKYQPRHPGGCVVMQQEKPVGLWEVKNCTSFKAMSLCKQEIQFHDENEPNFQQPHFQQPHASCVSGWESDHHLLSCFKVFHSEKVLMKRSWDEAEALCQDFGAHLASFTHAFEEDFLNKLLNTMFHNAEQREFWIGLNKRNPLSGGSWEWSDGALVASAFLENTYIEDDVRNCAGYKVNGTFLPLHCSSQHEWICKITKGVKPKSPPWYTNEPSWFYYQGAEYFFHVSASDWATFQFVCGWLHGDIVTIHSSKEQEFIQNRIKKCFLVQIPKDPNHLKSWYSAQTSCTHYGGSLASIDNEIEQAFITMNLFGHKSNVWIGLQSNDYEKWVNGHGIEYTNWCPVQAMHNLHNYSAETQEKIPLCTSVLNNPNFSLMGKWYLENCDKGFGFVCQKAQDTSRYVIDPSVMYPIPDTLEYANKTYILISGNMTWYMALETCKANGAELVSITDHYHQAFLTVITNRLGYPNWIGLFTSDCKIKQELIQYYLWQNGLNFQWSDGTKPFLTFWGDEESQTFGSCVYVDITGHWRSTNCENLLKGAVCHIPPKRKPTDYNRLCDERTIPWIKFENSCYSFSTVLKNLNFDEAFEFCKKQGSNLLTIKDENENAFLLEELHSFGSSVEKIWLNIQFLAENNTVEWFDGSPIHYSNWGIKKPELGQLKGNVCIALRTMDGVWQLSPCQEKKGFVCKTTTDYHEVTIQTVQVSYHRIVVMVVLTTLAIVISALAVCWWCMHKPSGLTRRILQFRNSHPVEAKSEVPMVEESTLISDLEMNDDV
ncbi:hypothetical protein lerEdw1_017435 [Lerista edwardsae]|nr:hypothetical protein lerEdw1_017435 [Lerista edwardsae]